MSQENIEVATTGWLQARVIAEKDDLDQKMIKLFLFMGSAMYSAMLYDDRQRLRRQYNAMTNYRDILVERIANFSV